MDVLPVVRHMLLCDDARVDPSNPRKVDLFGLVSALVSTPGTTFPLCHPQLCVYIQLTNGRGTGRGQIVAVEADSDEVVWSSSPKLLAFGNDPVAVGAIVFRLQNCVFPRPGLYSIEFRYNDQKIAQENLLVR